MNNPALNDQPTQAAQRLAYSIAETCALTGIGRTTLYRYVGSGALPVVKIGNRTLVRHDDLRQFLQTDHPAA